MQQRALSYVRIRTGSEAEQGGLRGDCGAVEGSGGEPERASGSSRANAARGPTEIATVCTMARAAWTEVGAASDTRAGVVATGSGADTQQHGSAGEFAWGVAA